MKSSAHRPVHSSKPGPGSRGRIRTIVPGALVVLIIAVGVGCGSDSEETTTTTGAQAVTATSPASAVDTGDSGDPDDSADEMTGSSEVGAVNACALLDEAAVTEIIGVPLAEATTEETYGDFVCDLRPADPEVRAQFKLVVDTDNGSTNFPRQRELAANPEDVDGLGDEAFRSGPNLFVRKGSILLYVNVVRPDTGSGESGTEALRAVLATALENLDQG